ncbi:MAG: hypothetical protein QF554_12705 [Dehalococcoidia bacterium]|nr:hypothetical protein [Dehalococcoidia bacterium]
MKKLSPVLDRMTAIEARYVGQKTRTRNCDAHRVAGRAYGPLTWDE